MDNENIDNSKFNSTGISSTRIETPPPPNWRFYFGDVVKHNIQWNIRIDNPPNRFQRWLCYKAFRLTWEEIK